MSTLKDYLITLEELNKPIEAAKAFEGKANLFQGPILFSEALELVKDHLLTLEDFKDVKKINVYKLPTILVDKETRLPAISDPNNLGDKTNLEVENFPVVLYKPGEIEFAEEIDLYSIDLTVRMYDPSLLSITKLGPGVWIMPIVYNEETFEPLRSIQIIYSPEVLQDLVSTVKPEEVEKILKERILDKVEKALYEQPNVPSFRNVMIRCSSRSFKIAKKEEI